MYINILKWILLVLYISALVFIVFFLQRRQELAWEEELVNLIPFQNTVNWFHSLPDTPDKHWSDFFYNLFGNILLFVPFAIFTIEIFSVRNIAFIIGAGAVASFVIEVNQYLWRIGVPDIDDLLLNTLGTLVGVVSWKFVISNTKHNVKQLKI